MNWLEFFFGWITKPYIQWNFIDGLLCSIEFIILFIIGFSIYDFIQKKKYK